MLDFDAVRPFYPFHPSAELISLAQTLFAQGSIDPSVPLLKPEELSAVAGAVQDYLKDGGAWFAPCQEVLRQPFYDAHWSLDACRRHRIFLSQSHYPIKGLHKFLEALPLILRHYPDTEVHIVGDDPTRGRWYQRSGYGNLIRHLMRTYKLKRHIHFVGRLDADQMVAELREAHVFVCPSAIENSSNSVCEAQLMGTPTVASYVGGLMDLVTDGRSGLLYRFEETRMLAEKVCRIFADDDLARRLSAGAYEAASFRHRRGDIARALYDIYQAIR